MRCLRVRTLTALAAIAGVGALDTAAAASPGGAKVHAAPSVIVRVNEDDSYRRPYRRGSVVDAPTTHVDTRGPVIVDAPFAHVGVSGNRVRVIAPFVNLSIPR
jgi:hypothetical protein